MVHKKFNNYRTINAEKYIFLLLLFSYILGICIGSYFVMSENTNADFSEMILSDSSFKVLIYFILALLFKYSGVLSGLLGILPMFLGIHNSANYCCTILDKADKYKTALTMLKDTAIVMLLAFYIIVIINQIINKKYTLKKDVKYFFVYFTASVIIIIIELIVKSIIF